MGFPCPGCESTVERSPDAWLLRCPDCRRAIRSRPVDGPPDVRVFDVEIAGHPETRRRVHLPWHEADRRRLGAWLIWSSIVTLGLVLLLYALAVGGR
jgi:hypothetical protein